MNNLNLDTRYLILETSQEILKDGIPIRCKVGGISMLPLLWPDDVIIIDPIDIEQIAIGDIVVFKLDNRLVAHRLISISSNNNSKFLFTKGDSNLKKDEPFSAELLIGVVRNVVKNELFIPINQRKSLQFQLLAKFPIINSLIFKVVGKLYLIGKKF